MTALTQGFFVDQYSTKQNWDLIFKNYVTLGSNGDVPENVKEIHQHTSDPFGSFWNFNIQESLHS